MDVMNDLEPPDIPEEAIGRGSSDGQAGLRYGPSGC